MQRKVFRARPKKYFGIPRHKVNPISASHSSLESEAETSVEAQAETPFERPVPRETASYKKFAISSTLGNPLDTVKQHRSESLVVHTKERVTSS